MCECTSVYRACSVTSRLRHVAAIGPPGSLPAPAKVLDAPLALMSGWQEIWPLFNETEQQWDTFRKQLQDQDCSSLLPLPRAARPHQDRRASHQPGPWGDSDEGCLPAPRSDVQPSHLLSSFYLFTLLTVPFTEQRF